MATGSKVTAPKTVTHEAEGWSVYIDERGVHASLSEGEGKTEFAKRKLRIEARINEINALINLTRPWPRAFMQNYWNETISQYREFLAVAYTQALIGLDKQAVDTLDILEHRIRAKITNTGRSLYFIWSMVAAFLLSVIYGLVDYNLLSGELNDNSRIWNYLDADQLLFAGFWGVIGALFSAVISVKRVRTDFTVGALSNISYAIQRVTVGALAAIVVYLALSSDVLTSLLSINEVASSGTAGSQNSAKIAFLSVLAGFSEQFVPNILDNEASRITAKDEDEHNFVETSNVQAPRASDSNAVETSQETHGKSRNTNRSG
jgi:hypothetical protein